MERLHRRLARTHASGEDEGNWVMFDEGKLQTLLLMVFGVVILIVAIAVAATAKRAKYSETVRVGFNVVVSIVLVAVGLGAIGYAAFGTQVLEALGIIQGSGSGPGN
jgi:hypothetical protein